MQPADLSPLAALARGGKDRPAFLCPHHVEAGERVRRLFDRAHLSPRVTMSYSPLAVSGGKRGDRMADLTDMAAEARKALADLHRHLPPDCAGVILDVCGFEKGLQIVEAERGWPRRSAKLVLRIGLEQLAQHYGLVAMAEGPERGRARAWVSEGAVPREVG